GHRGARQARNDERASDGGEPRGPGARRSGANSSSQEKRASGATMTQRTLFGTDGIRGLANTDPMTPEVALRLGMAISARFRSAHVSAAGPDVWRHGRIVIGKDTRLSGYLFETALASGIVSMRADVM